MAEIEKNLNLPGAVNPADFLFKLAMQRQMAQPVFEQLAESGPPHMKTFHFQCTFNNLIANGCGRSKKEAKSAAARAIREQLTADNLPPEVSHQQKTDKRMKKESKRKQPDSGNSASAPKKKYDYRRHVQMMERQRQLAMMGMMLPDMPLNFGGPMVEDPSKQAEENMIKKFGAEGDDSFECGPMGQGFFPPPPLMMPRSRFGRQPYFMRPRTSLEDRYVLNKHKEIFPKDSDLNEIMKLVEQTENALEKAAKELKDLSNPIMGVARVGDLAKGLLLADHRSVQMILMCKYTPGNAFLTSVFEKTTTHLKEISEKDSAESKGEFSTDLLSNEAAFRVSLKTNELTYTAKVTLTSSVIRKKALAEEKQETSDKDAAESEEKNKEEVQDIDVPDSLPKDFCLEALRKVRRSKWFETMAVPLPSCVECIRIVKDLSERDCVWSPLSSWALELLVERALFTAGQPMSPSASLTRVMEVISSGVFLPGGPGLKDPCEREDVDVTNNLTVQQKEELTWSAQKYLRYITYRKIHLVLGVERLPPKERKNKVKEEEEAKEKAKNNPDEKVEANEEKA